MPSAYNQETRLSRPFFAGFVRIAAIRSASLNRGIFHPLWSWEWDGFHVLRGQTNSRPTDETQNEDYKRDKTQKGDLPGKTKKTSLHHRDILSKEAVRIEDVCRIAAMSRQRNTLSANGKSRKISRPRAKHSQPGDESIHVKLFVLIGAKFCLAVGLLCHQNYCGERVPSLLDRK